MSERDKFQGRLSEQVLEAKRIELRLKGLCHSLRDLLDPFEGVEKMKGDQIADQALQFATLQIELKQVQTIIAEIRDILA